MTSQKIRQYLTFNMQNSYAEVYISHKIFNKNLQRGGREEEWVQSQII